MSTNQYQSTYTHQPSSSPRTHNQNRCGTCGRASSSTRCTATRAPPMRWRSHPLGTTLPARAPMSRCAAWGGQWVRGAARVAAGQWWCRWKRCRLFDRIASLSLSLSLIAHTHAHTQKVMVWRTNFDRQLEGYTIASAVCEGAHSSDPSAAAQHHQPQPQQPNAHQQAAGALRASGGNAGALGVPKRPTSAHQQQQLKPGGSGAAQHRPSSAVAAAADPQAYAAGRYTEAAPAPNYNYSSFEDDDEDEDDRVAAAVPMTDQRVGAAQPAAAAGVKAAAAAAVAPSASVGGGVEGVLADTLRDIVLKLDNIATVSRFVCMCACVCVFV